jgi:hypothetical protein
MAICSVGGMIGANPEHFEGQEFHRWFMNSEKATITRKNVH